MAFDVSTFKDKMTGDGARPNLFKVSLTGATSYFTSSGLEAEFFIRASSIPGATLGQVVVPYFGREVKFAGNRTFADWTATIINDEDMQIRNAMEEWSNTINGFQTNLRKFGASSPALYKSTAQVTQFSKTGTPVRVYNFVGIFPTEVSAIEMDWGTDAVSEFTVTFTYDYWEVSGGITGNAGGL